ncbi:MAG TPA: DUF4337 family protein [Rariglobus sp.]|nr:DUF4337 family protein [Rariglobus sp.]
MKTTIPDALKADIPDNKWGKLFAATPVIMTVIATMLAGLASSEMTRAQYDRSLAAQQQSKAGDQWSFFQAKKLRSALQHNTLDMVESTTEVHPLDADALKNFLLPPLTNPEEMSAPMRQVMDSPAGRQALVSLQTGALPRTSPAPAVDSRVKAALDALRDAKPDSEVLALLAPIPNETLARALQAAEDYALAVDAATSPVGQAIDAMEKELARQKSIQPYAPVIALSRSFTGARLRYNSTRYDAEARLNQVVATLYELQVRKSNVSAERHHNRSQRFFFGMLAAQMGVIIATFAMAAKQRNLLWSLAAGAGVIAIAFAIYVYLYV